MIVRPIVRPVVRSMVNPVDNRLGASWDSYWNPQYTGAIANATPTLIEITFNKTLNESSVPATSAFSLAGKTISNVAISGAVVTLTVTDAYIYGNTPILVYNKPVLNPIKSGSTEVDSFVLSITNNILIDSDADTFISKITTEPSLGVKKYLNKWFVGVKADGVYSELDALSLYFLPTEQGSLLNVKNNNSFNHTVVGTPTHTPYTGYTITTGSYIRSHFIPSSDGSKFTLNDAGIFMERTNVTGTHSEGVSTAAGIITFGYNAVLKPYNQLNSLNGANFLDFAWGSGSNAFVRLSATQILTRTGATETTYDRSSVALPTKEIYIGAFNNNGTVANNNVGAKYKYYGVGSKMTEAKRLALETRTATLYNDLQLQKVLDAAAADIDVADVFDNVLNNSLTLYTTGFSRRIPFAKFEFNTSNTKILIKAQPTIYSAFPDWAEVSIFEDDVYTQKVAVVDTAYKLITLSAGTKKVSIVEGLVSTATRIESGAVGTYLTNVYTTHFDKVLEGTVSDKIIFIGDSILAGGNSTTPEIEACTTLFRVENGKNVNVYSLGNTTLEAFAGTGGAITNCVNNIVTQFANVTGTKRLMLGLGTNDRFYSTCDAATFESWYGALLDAINAADNNIIVYCMSPVLRTDANEDALLDSFRAAILSLCSTRDYATHIVGKTILAAGYIDDGVHPTTAGQKKLKDALYAIIYP